MQLTGLQFHSGESPATGVQRIADQLLAAALHRARHPGRDLDEDVHFIRTVTKQLRALLQLIRPVIAKPAFARSHARLQSAARHLAPFRDHAVAGRTLTTLANLTPRECELLLGKAKTRAAGQRALRAVVRDLEQSRRDFQRLRITGDGWDVIGPGLARVYRQARRRMKTAIATTSDRAFHRWRFRVKQLYYQLHWLAPVWPRRFAKMHKRLQELETALGTDHDLVALRSLLAIAARRSADAATVAALAKSAAQTSRRLRRASASVGKKALAEKPRHFRQACAVRGRAWAAGCESSP